MSYNIVYFIQSLILLFLTPLFVGLLKKFKAYVRGYQGPSIFQLYFDVIKLFKKDQVISNSSSFITKIGPLVSFAAAVTVAFCIPVFYAAPHNSFGNIFIIIFVIAIIKFFNSLIGLDGASTFGGMGSSRELFISMLTEPIMFILITFLYLETKTFNLFDISFINSHTAQNTVTHIIAAFAFFILILAENARIPVDNPETHLELTMVHEAMILDLSGKSLAYAELASSIKLIVFLTIFINAFMPAGMAATTAIPSLLVSFLLYSGKLILSLAVISIIETTMSKFRLFRAPELLASAYSIGIVAIIIKYYV